MPGAPEQAKDMHFPSSVYASPQPSNKHKPHTLTSDAWQVLLQRGQAGRGGPLDALGVALDLVRHSNPHHVRHQVAQRCGGQGGDTQPDAQQRVDLLPRHDLVN